MNELACGGAALLDSVGVEEGDVQGQEVSTAAPAPKKAAPKAPAKKEETSASPVSALSNMFKGIGSLFSR